MNDTKRVIDLLEIGRSARLAFFLPSADSGGAERAIISMANQVADLGSEVHLLLARATGPFLAEISPNVELVDLATDGKLANLLALKRYLRTRQPSVIMSALDIPNILLVIASKLARFEGKVVISQRSTIAPVYSQFSWFRRTVILYLMRRTYPLADAIICNSQGSCNEILLIPGVSTDSTNMIHNSVDVDRVNRESLESLDDVWYQKNSLPLILSVGSLTVLKDRSTLIRAFAILRERCECRLAILGEKYDLEEWNKLKNLVSQLGIADSVYMPGFESNPFKWMRRSAVLVSSSITEGCPNQLLEGLSLGVGIVATDCPGDTSEIVECGRWARLVPISDPPRMAKAIQEALEDENPVDGRMRALDFSPEKVLTAYLEVLLDKVLPSDHRMDRQA